ncbi:hypothetical protein NQ318_020472 [Aromia moschata]|uniref:Transmembrane inner ear expressed protein n=1 Tax=Aromia moschata TaxID=1265417 RepID=A0AAV8YJV8_9CUCU|nr:hypothetical protein NQ318_020472 [Aromia moschata]
MVTFYANPDDKNEPWIERAAVPGYGFRIWHYIFFCFSAFTILVIFICCCVKIRVPRTKQEIEADYRRKKLADKFRQRLRLIQNQEMDALDLQKALEIIQEDYRKESTHCQYDVSPADFNTTGGSRTEAQQPVGNKIFNILKFMK